MGKSKMDVSGCENTSSDIFLEEKGKYCHYIYSFIEVMGKPAFVIFL